jgi:hypothetical protein
MYPSSGTQANHALSYIDMPTMSASGAVATIGQQSGGSFGNSPATLGYNKTSGILFMTLGCGIISKSSAKSIYTNGTVIGSWAGGTCYFTDYNNKNYPYFPYSYIGDSHAGRTIDLLNQSDIAFVGSQSLGAITTGSEGGIGFFTMNSSVYFLFDSDAVGNQEIYWALTNQTATSHRLTTTAQDEALTDVWQSTYGTVYMIYYVNNYPYLDYFCPLSNSALGTVCAGETGYAGTGAGNAQMPNNITQSSLYLQVYDNARCSTYGLGGKCKAFYLTNEDWLYAIFSVDGNYDNTSTCYAVSDTESIQMVHNNPSNPFGTGGLMNWSVQVNGCLLGCPVSMAGQKITVSCYANVSGGLVSVSVPFYVQDTDQDFIARGWSVSAGSSKDQNYDDIANLHDLIKIKTNVVEKSGNYNGWCWNNIGSKTTDASAYNGIQNAGKNLQTGENNFQFLYDYKTDEVGYSLLPNGYNYYTAFCGSWATSGYPRRSSEAEQRRLYVFDRCAGNYEGTTKLLTRFYDGNPDHIATTTGVFFIGQQPEMEITYRASYNTGDPFATKQTIPNPVCTVTFTHSNTTVMFSKTFYRDQIENIGCLFSESPTGKFCDIPIILAMTDNNDNQLPVGNYTYSISCVNKETNLCLPDVSSSGSFNFSNTPANCAGTVESCGIGEACESCAEGITFECENPDYSINIPQECYNQYCLDVASTDTSTLIGRYIASPPCSIYSVTAGYNQLTSTMSCAKKANLLFYGIVNKLTQQADIGSEGSCELKFYEKYSSTLLGKINLGYGNAMKWNPLTKRFELSYADLKKEWASRVSDGDFLHCGTDYRMEVKCSSSLFKVAHVGTFDFSIGGLDFCSDGTSSGSCVFERTLNDADKPLYCDTTFALINNSQTCGCPVGLRANSSTNSCYGNRSTNEVSKDDIKGWLIAIFNNWWLVLIIMVGVILMFKRQRIEHT